MLWDSNESANQHIVDAVKLLGVEVFSYTVDVTNREEVEECARRVNLCNLRSELYVHMKVLHKLRQSYCAF